MTHSMMTRVLCCIACIAAAAHSASAQGNPPGTVTVSAAVTGIRTFDAGLGQGGQMRWSSSAISGSVTRQLVPAFAAGISLRYASEEWLFDSPATFEGMPPWRDLRRAGVGLNLSLALSRTLLVGLSPAVEWANDARADAADGLTYGAVVSAVKVFRPDLTLGTGASIHRRFYSVKVSPFVVVNWKLNEYLRIANTLSAGPEGGAGVELRWTFAPDWELAGGGVTKSDRYRLAPAGPYAGDIGETSSIPLFARLSRKLGPLFKADLYLGSMAQGRLKIKDSGGREIASDDYRIAPAIAATISFKR